MRDRSAALAGPEDCSRWCEASGERRCGDNGGTLGAVSVATKDRTLKFRVSQESDARLRAAAEIAGETLTEFTLRPALERADTLLARADATVLEAEDFAALMDHLAEPVTPAEELARIAAEPRAFTRA